MLVDTKLANNGQKILDKVKSVTDKPITHIINTHTHGDHVGSNDFFPPTVDIVVHENTAANMNRMEIFKDPAKKHGLARSHLQGQADSALRTTTRSISITSVRRTPAATPSWCFATCASCMPATPFRDRSFRSWTRTTAAAASRIRTRSRRRESALLGNVDRVIPGHSAVTTPQAFRDYTEFITTFVSVGHGGGEIGKDSGTGARRIQAGRKVCELRHAARQGERGHDLQGNPEIGPVPTLTRRPTTAALAAVREYIDRHYAEALTIDDLADRAGLSSFHFIRAFRAAFDATPHQYLRARRLDRAKELLVTTAYPVTEICDQIGFQSLGSFSSLFRRLTGEPPAEYRAKRRKSVYIPTCFIRMYRAD